MALLARETRYLTIAGSVLTCSPIRSTGARSSRENSCQERTSRSTRLSVWPRQGRITCWCCRGICARRSARSSITCGPGAAGSCSRSLLSTSSDFGGLQMKVVLFCGGLGMRMRDGVNTGPKPMAMIGERPLLWHVMRYYAHFGHTEFVLCLGYGASYVKDFFLNYDETRSNDFVLEKGATEVRLFSTDISEWRITFVDTGLNSPIGERLRRVRRFVEDEPMFMANYADVLTNAELPDMIERFEASDAVAGLLAVPPQSSHHVVDIGEDYLITQV